MGALEAQLFGPSGAPDLGQEPSAMGALERDLTANPPPEPAPGLEAPSEPAPTPQVAAAPPAPSGENSIWTGFRSGMAGQNVRGTGQFMQDVGAMLESERLDAWGKSLEGFGAARETPSPVPRLRDIHSLGSAAQYAGYQVGQGVASSLPSLAAGIAGAVTGGAVAGPVGALIGSAGGAAGTSYVQNEGDISQELEDLGMTDPQARARAAMRIAVPVAALDVIPTGRLLRILVGGRAPVEIAKRGLLRGLVRIGMEAGKQTAWEGATEGAQEAMQYTGARVATEKPVKAGEMGERALEAAVAGGLAGGVMGGGAQAYEEVTRPAAPGAPAPAPPPPPSGTPPAGGSALNEVARLLDDVPAVDETGAPGAEPGSEGPGMAPAPPMPAAGQPGPVSRETPIGSPPATPVPDRITETEAGRMLGRAEARAQESQEPPAPAAAPGPRVRLETLTHVTGLEDMDLDALTQLQAQVENYGERAIPAGYQGTLDEAGQARYRQSARERAARDYAAIDKLIERKLMEGDEEPAQPTPAPEPTRAPAAESSDFLLQSLRDAVAKEKDPTILASDFIDGAGYAGGSATNEAWHFPWAQERYHELRRRGYDDEQILALYVEGKKRQGFPDAEIAAGLDKARTYMQKAGKRIEAPAEPAPAPAGEEITAAAIRDPKTGVVHTGTDHGDILEKAAETDLQLWKRLDAEARKQENGEEGSPHVGFQTDQRELIDRKEAARLARARGQTKSQNNELVAADLEPTPAPEPAQTPAKRPPTPQVPHGVGGSTSYVLPSFATTGQRPEPASGHAGTMEDVLAKTRAAQQELMQKQGFGGDDPRTFDNWYNQASALDRKKWRVLEGQATEIQRRMKLRDAGKAAPTAPMPEAPSSGVPKVEGPRVTFADLPEGARFRFPDMKGVYVREGPFWRPAEGGNRKYATLTNVVIPETPPGTQRREAIAGLSVKEGIQLERYVEEHSKAPADIPEWQDKWLRGHDKLPGESAPAPTTVRGENLDALSDRDLADRIARLEIQPKGLQGDLNKLKAEQLRRHQARGGLRRTTPPLAPAAPGPEVIAAPEEVPRDRTTTEGEPAPGPVREGLAGSVAPGEPGTGAAAGEGGGPTRPGAVESGGGGSRGGSDRVAAPGERPAANREPRPSGEVREPPAEGPGRGDEPSPRAVRGAAAGLTGSNYRLTDADQLGRGTPSQKAAGNVAAITLLKEIEQANRPATQAEQAILAKYVGWGGLADAFDEKKPGYLPELKTLLTEAEYRSARASTPNAHYTSTEVIRAIYDALSAMGLAGGKLLEPAMGVGNFLGLTPESWRAQWWGVELDAITGRIGKLLYPKASVQVRGFEQTRGPDDTFDAIISNVPFGNYPVTDKRYARPAMLSSSIHNYYFARALDLVRPGGLIAFVTSRYTLDARSGATFRDYIATKADFLGAIRLPSLAFKENADTEVVTDVIFLRKYEAGEGISELKKRGLSSGSYTEGPVMIDTPEGKVEINAYFRDNPNNIVGTLTRRSGRFGAEPTVTVDPETYPQLLRTTFARMTAKLRGVYTPAAIESLATSEAAEEAALTAPGEVKEGGFVFIDGKLHQQWDGKLRPAAIPAASADRVGRLVTLIEDLRGLIQAERQDRPPADVERRRGDMAKHYQAFVKKYGPITKETRTSYINKQGKEVVTTHLPNLKIIREDPSVSFLFALEQAYDLETGKATPGNILSERTVKPERTITAVNSPADALPYVLNQVGRVDLERIAALAGTTPDAAGQALFQQGLIYDDPLDNRWVTADEYLSGDVRAKLVTAQDQATREPRFAQHVKALEAIQPEDLTPGQIHVALGAPWIPATDIEAFARHLFGQGTATVRYFAHDGSWHVETDYRMKHNVKAESDWGTDRINGVDLLVRALNGAAPMISDPVPGEPKKRKKNVQATIEAEAKWQGIKDRFGAWIWEDAKRADRLVRYYNTHFNNLRLRRYDGSHLTFPGQTKLRHGDPFALDKHQRDAAWRILQGNTLLAHVVGAGKTFTMISAGMEAKRLGLATKPIYVVPNYLLPQFAREFRELYPSANVLIAEPEDVTKENRARFQAKVTGSNWDGIIITHSSFERIPMSLEFQQEQLNQQLDALDRVMADEAARGDRKSATVKDIEKAKKRLLARIAKLTAEWKKDEALIFEELGIDMLFVDEGHLFKNLMIASRRRGVAIDGSQRAFDLYLKSLYLDQQRPGWGVNFATGTPIANSVGEMFTVQRYLGRRALLGNQLGHFDAWASTFGDEVTGLEMTPDGSGYRMKSRFNRFKNIPELTAMFRTFADVQLAEDLNLKTPKLIGGKARAIVSAASSTLRRYIEKLLYRAQHLPPGRPDLDNWLKIVGDGRHAALDIRFIDPNPAGDPEGKVAKAAREIATIWEETTPHKGTQLVFGDLGTPKDAKDAARKPAKIMTEEGEVDAEEGEGLDVSPRGGVVGFDVYHALKRELIAAGIPEKEIAFIHEANSNAKRFRLFADVNAGRVRVLIGSTEKLAAGANVQARLVALHHLDAPWRPADVEQREGRILRQGNLLYNAGQIEGVRIFRYVTEASFDAFMWGVLEMKAYMINQVMKGDLTVREIEDLDSPVVADFAQMKAITSGNPAVMEKATVDAQVTKLDRLRKGHIDAQFRIRQDLARMPEAIAYWIAQEEKQTADDERWVDTTGDKFTIQLMGKEYTKRVEAQAVLYTTLQQVLAKHAQTFRDGELPPQHIGRFAGFDVYLATTPQSLSQAALSLSGQADHFTSVDAIQTATGLLATLENIARRIPSGAAQARERRVEMEQKEADLEKRVDAPFEKQEDLDALLKRQAALNAQLTQKDKGVQTPAAEEESDDEGDEDEGIEFRETFPGGLPDQIRRALERKREREHILAPFSSAEAEERFQQAKGLTPATLQAKLADQFTRLRNSLRHFAAIDPTAGPLEARANQILLEVEGAQPWAQAQAVHQVRQIIKGLTVPEVDLLTRHFALADLQKDIDEGLYDGKELPFALTPAAVASEISRVRQLVSTNVQVARAIHLRDQTARAMTEALVAADQLPASVLEDPRYYHRQVLEYFNALPPATQRPGTSAQEARVHRKGFQRARVGGGDFNTRFHEAEFEWLAQAHRILHMVSKLEELKQLADIQGRLKGEAKQLNAAALQELPPGQLEQLEGFATRIGRATAELYKMAADGTLHFPGFESMLGALAESYQEWRDQPRRARGEGPRPPFRFSHPQWFPFLKRVLEEGQEGRIQAAVIFKALHERETAIQGLLGKAYRTWEDLIPSGYRTWQPVKGNHFFQALGVAERALQQYLAGERTLQESDFREMLTVGPARETWVIPEWMATTMDAFGKQRETSAFGRAWVFLENSWKRWQLLNPLRLLKYNFNNLSGDFDASLLQPGIHKHTAQAVRDLWAYRSDTASPALAAEIHRWMQLRVIDQGMTVVEIPDLSRIGAFERLSDPNPFRFMYWTGLYWQKARGLTLFRENIFRLAAARYYLEHPNTAGPASNPQELRHIKDPHQRAAKLSRDLIGDYGNISEAGQWARDRVAPFFSWQEINAKRYVTVMRNLVREDLSPGQRASAGAVLAKRGVGLAAKRLLQVNAFFLMMALWNRLFFPDEDDELRERGRNLHLILGRYKDGSVRSIRIEGAWSDFLEWLNLHDYPGDVKDVLKGTRTVGDKLHDMARAPLEKIANLWEPVSKTFMEVLTKRATYPTPFDTRPIRDRWEHVFNSVSLGWLYREVTDKPNPPSSGYTQFLLQRTDPGEAAYFGIKQREADYLAKEGKERSDPNPTERDNTLYYWRKALEWGEEAKADRWLHRYFALGGTRESAQQSIKRARPLKDLSQRDRSAFIRSLDGEGRDMLKLANAWYLRGLRATSGPSVGRTPQVKATK